jgi:hypothetical protein
LRRFDKNTDNVDKKKKTLIENFLKCLEPN